MSVSSDSHSPFPVLPTRSDSARPLSTHSASGQDSSPSFRFCLLDLILSVRFSPYQILSRGCGFCLRMPEREFSALPADFLATRPDSRFLIPVFARRRGGSPAGRPSGHAHSTNHAHVYAPYPPRHPLCHRSALRAPHSTVTFERRLITRASEISWAVAWWSQSSARPILILGRRPPIPAGAWSRGLNGMPASDAAWRRPAATPQAVVGAAQRCSQRHVCSFAVGSAV